MVSFQLMFSVLLFLIFFLYFFKMSLQWTSWLAGLHFIPTPRRYSKNVHTVGGSTLMSNPQPFDINRLFILYHITIFLYYSIFYNKKR